MFTYMATLLMACSTRLTPNVPVTTAPKQAASVSAPTRQSSVVPTAMPSAQPNNQWKSISKGIEHIRILGHSNSLNVDHPLMIVRIDPMLADIKVQYMPKMPRRISEWQGDTKADVVINAGFFTPEKLTTGLLISDGKISGQSYSGYGGMFFIRDGKPRLQWLGSQPYSADPKITQAVQTFPMLVQNGKIMSGLPNEDRNTYRSFVAIDKTGKVLLGITRSSAWMLTDLAAMLVSQPILNVDSALNLDGGASSGLWVKNLPESDLFDSFDTVPSVIIVKSK